MKHALDARDDLARQVLEPLRIERGEAWRGASSRDVVDAGHHPAARQGQQRDVRAGELRRKQESVVGRLVAPAPGGVQGVVVRRHAGQALHESQVIVRIRGRMVARSQVPEFVPAVEQHEIGGERFVVARRWARQHGAHFRDRTRGQQIVRPAQDAILQRVRSHGARRGRQLLPCSRAACRTCRYSWPRCIMPTNAPGSCSCTALQRRPTAVRSAVSDSSPYSLRLWIS